MIAKANAVEIPNFPLEKVRAAPQAASANPPPRRFPALDAHAQSAALLSETNLIDDFEARFFFLPIIHRGDVRKEIETELQDLP